MVIEQAELDAAERERQRIIIQGLKFRAKPAEPYYVTWCYCSWCPLSRLSTPHYRRHGQCPSPDDYVIGPDHTHAELHNYPL